MNVLQKCLRLTPSRNRRAVFVSEQRLFFTGIGGTYADNSGDGGCYSIDGNRGGNPFGHDVSTVEDNGERDDTVFRHVAVLGLFVEHFPSRGDFQKDVAADGGIVASSYLFHVLIARGKETFACKDIAHSFALHKELTAAQQQLGISDSLLFHQSPVEINLVSVICIYIASLSVDGT